MTKTTDLVDAHEDEVWIAEPMFRTFGGILEFDGPIATVKVHEDNALVRKRLEEPGQGRVLVIDGGGSKRSALIGDRLAALGAQNGWKGVIVYGAVRDSLEIGKIAIGCVALATHPKKSAKTGHGYLDIPVTFAGVSFVPGEHVWVDPDGIVLARTALRA